MIRILKDFNQLVSCFFYEIDFNDPEIRDKIDTIVIKQVKKDYGYNIVKLNNGYKISN